MADVLGLIESKDLLAFSQNYSIERNYVGNRLFPNIKTENLEAEYYSMSALNQLPTLAKVHAFDSETVIGNRPGLDKFNFEKLLVKEKINQSERTQFMLDHGVAETGLVRTVFDDINRLANNVIARAEKMKMDILTTGTLVINENNLNFTVDFGIPGSNKKSYDWGSPEHDILGDIQAMVDLASANGQAPDVVVTSRKIVRYMQKNKYIQSAINSALGVGTFVDGVQINNLMERMFGFSIIVDEDVYASESISAGVITRTKQRFFAENKFVMTSQNNGAGLWGPTPEEKAYGPYTDKSSKQYVTVAQWQTPDPVALWTKASGLIVPIIPQADAVVIATIAFDGNEHSLDNLTVSSAAGTAVGDTAITVSPALTSGNSYKYKVATDVTFPTYGQNLRSWTTWDGTSDISAATGKEICVAEVDGDYKAVKAGITTVTAKAS